MTIAITFDNQLGRGDWGRNADGTLATGDALQSAIWISLFTDRRAHPDDVLTDGTDDRRGWWADAFVTRPIGSRLWLLNRALREDKTLRRAEDYAREALAWLVADGVAARVEVTAEWHPKLVTMMVVRPVLIHRAGRQQAFAYEWAWQRSA